MRTRGPDKSMGPLTVAHRGPKGLLALVHKRVSLQYRGVLSLVGRQGQESAGVFVVW
jgi:hypothetical protein